jgi:DNA-binding NarL/FixJ family response regulator
MGTVYSPQELLTEPLLLIIDSMKLRQAGIVNLFKTWAESVGLRIGTAQPNLLSEIRNVDPNCKIIILSVGSASVSDPEQQAWIKSLRALAPGAALIVLSDRVEAEEVCAALTAGTSGFVPTSIEPSLALDALSFVNRGGSFFPALVLLQAPGVSRDALEQGTSIANQPTIPSSIRSDAFGPRELTCMQREVLKLLHRGLQNKLIARQLNLSEATVKVHVRQIMRKFGVTNRTQVALTVVDGRPSSTFTENGDGSQNDDTV